MAPPASKDTVALLNKMMADSGVSAAQQKKLRAVANGQRVAAVSRGQRKAAPQPAPRQYQDRYRGIALNPHLVGGRAIKSHAAIVADANGYEREQYCGSLPTKDRAQQKSALQDSYLGANAQTASAAPFATGVTGSSTTGRAPGSLAAVPKESVEAHLHKAISEEVRERQEFMRDMAALGKTEHEGTVKAQIADRMVEMRRLEELMS